MAQADTTHGMIAVDKMGTQVLFLNPQTFDTEKIGRASCRERV